MYKKRKKNFKSKRKPRKLTSHLEKSNIRTIGKYGKLIGFVEKAMLKEDPNGIEFKELAKRRRSGDMIVGVLATTEEDTQTLRQTEVLVTHQIEGPRDLKEGILSLALGSNETASLTIFSLNKRVFMENWIEKSTYEGNLEHLQDLCAVLGES